MKLPLWTNETKSGRFISFSPKYAFFIESQSRNVSSIDIPDHMISTIHDTQINCMCPTETEEPISELQLVVTLTCPAKCEYCYARKAVTGEYLTSDNVDKVVDYIGASVGHISMFGGEPFLDCAQLETLLSGLKDKYPDATMNVATGLMMTDKQWEIAKGLMLKYDISATVTFDSPNPGLPYTRGSSKESSEERDFSRIIEMYDLGIKLDVSSMLTRNSLDPFVALSRIRDSAPRAKCAPTKLIMSDFSKERLSEEELVNFEKSYSNYLDGSTHQSITTGKLIKNLAWATMSCTSGDSSIAIMPDGSIANCFADVKLAATQQEMEDTASSWHKSINTTCKQCDMYMSCSQRCPLVISDETEEEHEYCKAINAAFIRPNLRNAIRSMSDNEIDMLLDNSPIRKGKQ